MSGGFIRHPKVGVGELCCSFLRALRFGRVFRDNCEWESNCTNSIIVRMGKETALYYALSVSSASALVLSLRGRYYKSIIPLMIKVANIHRVLFSVLGTVLRTLMCP